MIPLAWYLFDPIRATGVIRPAMSAYNGNPVAAESAQSNVNSPMNPIWLTIVASPVVKYFRSTVGFSQAVVAKALATTAKQTVTNSVRDMLTVPMQMYI